VELSDVLSRCQNHCFQQTPAETRINKRIYTYYLCNAFDSGEVVGSYFDFRESGKSDLFLCCCLFVLKFGKIKCLVVVEILSSGNVLDLRRLSNPFEPNKSF